MRELPLIIYSLRVKTPPHPDPLPRWGEGRVRGKGGFSPVTSIVCSMLLYPGIPCLSQSGPGNLELKGKDSASSEFSDQYRAALAIDGVIPGSLTQDDIGRVWAVQGATAGDRSTFSLESKDTFTLPSH